MYYRPGMKQFHVEHIEQHPALGRRVQTYRFYTNSEQEAREWVKSHQEANGVTMISELSFCEVK